ncbi:hypothetical protein ABID97_003630 [Variovorax sp. OAS795]|uniref:DUF6361 family protein n=1 Tax=Variovorax sp. OAS795 TaxID=3034231 RepID=UPI003399E7EE
MTAASRWEWLDFDEAESKQVRDFLSQGVDGEGVDPLRLGASVRDRMADHLFPGTSTQYTRLRYVLLTSAILRKKGATIGNLPQSQTMLNVALGMANPDEKGVIGRRRPERDFVHLYWSALRTWKLLTPVTADPRDITVPNGLVAMQSKVATDEEGSPLLEHRVQWDPKVVMLADQFWGDPSETTRPSIHCTRAEVNFILGQWEALPGNPPLAVMASQLKKGRRLSMVNYPWEMAVGSCADTRADFARAKAVSLICWSAQLAYNFALLEAARRLEAKGQETTTWQQQNQDLGATQKRIDKLFTTWKEAFDSERATLAPWTEPSHWEPLGSESSRTFLASTAQRLVAGSTALKSAQWSAWVRQRETVNPAPKLSNDHHLAAWSGTPEMARRWDFRWGASVRRFVQDAENPRG